MATDMSLMATGGYSIDLGDSYPETYCSLGVKYETKLNVTGGLLFDFESGFVMGLGFDTKPSGINLMIGFNIK